MEIQGSVGVAREICDRLRDVRILLPTFVDSVKALDSTLKGINFTCDEPTLKALTLAFDNAKDSRGREAFYYNGQYGTGRLVHELLRNAPDLLDMSFGATDGYGYREIRDMPLVPSLSGFIPPQVGGKFSSRFGFEDEQTVSFDVTSLHAALGHDICNVHIDQMGFVMRGPNGAFLDPDFAQHLVNELGFQTDFAPFLGQGIGRVLLWTHLLRTDQGEAIGNWMAKNVNLELPNFRNGYRPGFGVNVNVTPNLTISAKFTAKCNFCRDKDDDFEYPIPDGNSYGVGLTYRWGGKR